MIVRPEDSAVSRMRDMIGRHLSADFAEFTGGPTLAVRLWPWEQGETQRIVVHQEVDFSRSADDAGPCRSVVRYLVMLVAGNPGGDTSGRMADWWTTYLMQPDVFAGITGDEWWTTEDAVPVVERVGGFRVYELADGPMVASETTVRTEIHNTERPV